MNAVLGMGGLRPGAARSRCGPRSRQVSCTPPLDRILQLHGCPSCGLSGLDLRCRPEDEIFSRVAQELPNVADISRLGAVGQFG